MHIKSFRIRASYPNYYMVKLYAEHGKEIFDFDNEDPGNKLEGNKPGTIIYTLDDDSQHEFPPRWYDMYYLLRLKNDEQKKHLEMLLEERFGEARHNTGSSGKGTACQELIACREAFLEECRTYVAQHPLIDNDHLITSLNSKSFTDEEISHKGRVLKELTQNCYPVPDFVILTAASFHHPEQLDMLIEQAISNLETMTKCKLGDAHNPLVFAIRCAMPQYIPGLMPTLLNIGVTHAAYQGLCHKHKEGMANRVYLSTLHNLSEMLGIEHRYQTTDIELSTEMQKNRITELEERIIEASPDGNRLLNDASFQVTSLIRHVRDFYIQNQDLILTFMQGKQASPSLILQRMVWTIGNNESYPGVLYSRHSRTGIGKQIESYRNIFGEEIMTGDVTSDDLSYSDRNEIIGSFPAVYHFHPLLKKLETKYKSPVTIEFAVETRPNRLSLFSVLQLNISEMTGRAALVSAINLRNEGLIDDSGVMDIIKPYHLRQIISASIDDSSIAKLQFFGKGLSVLPRTAITCVLCFTAAKARELKAKGENVCLCQDRFIPEDTITLNEVDAILSMTPAAIHVVTACRGYGIPAFMNLNNYGIRHVGDSIVNEEGLVINESDHITLSSKRQTIYKGVAEFKPARFIKYMENGPVDINSDEIPIYEEMKVAYLQYQKIVTSEKTSYINDINKLARLIRCDLQNKPHTAKDIVNSWYNNHVELYVKQVLESKMGDHQDQSRLFNLLENDRKIDCLKRASEICLANRVSGLKAGSFMLGRFVAKPLPVSIWNRISNRIVAFLLNEYVLYEKYLHVLQEVGEIRLARAHSRIETEGISNMNIQNFNIETFIPLIYSCHQWDIVAEELEKMEHQDNTHLLIEKLSKPIDQLYDLSKPWNRILVENMKNCK